MKYLFLAAKDIQCGDVIFVPDKKVCARVLGQNVPSPSKGVAEYRVSVLEGEDGAHTTLQFGHAEQVGVAREDDYVSVDVAALLEELDA